MFLAIELITSFSIKKNKMQEWWWNLRSWYAYFSCLHYPLSWSNGFCSGRAKWVNLMGSMFGWESATPLQILLQMLGDYISKIQFNIIVFSFLANRFHSDEERRIRRSNMKEKIPNFLFFGHIFKKTSTSTFWCMVNSLGPYSVYT